MTRPTTAQRGYGSRWQRISARKRKMDPWCETCLDRDAAIERMRAVGIPYEPPLKPKAWTPATTVDHIRPHRAGGGDDGTNLMSSCHVCHALKTAWERSVFGGGAQ